MCCCGCFVVVRLGDMIFAMLVGIVQNASRRLMAQWGPVCAAYIVISPQRLLSTINNHFFRKSRSIQVERILSEVLSSYDEIICIEATWPLTSIRIVLYVSLDPLPLFDGVMSSQPVTTNDFNYVRNCCQVVNLEK